MSRVPRVAKRLLDPVRVRRIRDGFSWIDRRFVREGIIHRLGRDEILLYFFLVSVADAHGLSYYSDRRISFTLQIPEPELERSRRRLVEKELVAFEAPLYQVLELPDATSPARAGTGGAVGEILRQVLARSPQRGA
jgi:hypothetical protein